MAKLGDLVVNIGANTKDLNKKLGRVRRDMRSMSSNFAAVGKNMTRSLTMPLALVGGAAVNLAVEFESAMAQVKAVSGATAGDFKRLEQSAKDLGASTIFTAREVAALQLEYSRLGFSADEIIQVQEATLNLAQATGSDLAQAAEVAGATLRAFGMDASETGRVTDVMAASFSASALNINTFQDSMKFVAPDAKAAGVSLEEVSAMLGVLANSGIKGSQAGTALRRILQEMTGTSGTLTERFAELAAKGIGVQGAMDEVGRRAGTSLLVLTEGVGQVDELTTAFENSAGAGKEMADVANDTAKGGLKAMTSALEGAGIALGEVLIPFVTDAANFIRELATDFKNLSVDTQTTIVKIAALVAAIGPLLIVLPNLVGATKLAAQAFVALSSPLGAIALAVGGAVLAFKGIEGVFEKSRTSAQRYQDSIRDTENAVRNQTAEVRYLINAYKDEEKSLDDRQRILDRLGELDAQHFGNLKAENTQYIDLQKSLDDYTNALRRNFIEKALAEEGSALFSQLAADEQAIQKKQDLLQRAIYIEEEAGNITREAAHKNTVQISGELDALNKKRDETLTDIEAFEARQIALLDRYATKHTETTNTIVENEEEQQDAVEEDNGTDDKIKKQELLAGSIAFLKQKVSDLREETENAKDGSKEQIDALDKWKDATEELENAVKIFNTTLEESPQSYPTGSLGALREELGDLREELASLIPGTQAFIDKMDEIDGVAQQVGEATESIEESFDSTGDSLTNFANNVASSLSSAASSMLSNVGQMIGGAEMGAEGILAPLADMAIQLGELAIGYGVAIGGIKKALQSLNPVVAIVAGVALVALGAGLKSAMSSIASGNHDMPELAEGGLAFGPTTALIGDNKNARIDPEVVAPLSKLQDMLGGGSTNVYGRISGDDIVISNDRATRDRNRYG